MRGPGRLPAIPLFAAALLVVGLHARPRGQEPAASSSSVAPLPESQPFYDEVRQNLARAQRSQNRFAYKERRTDLHMNPFGRIGTGGTRVYDVVPAPDGSSLTRRLIARDDMPIAGSTPEKIDLQRRTPRSGSRAGLDDVMQTLTFHLDRREVHDGVPTIVVTFAPRADAKPSTREGKLAEAFRGEIVVDERAREVQRVDAVAIDYISFGYGILARLNEGTRVRAERKPVGEGLWMPTAVRFEGEGRAALFRKLTIDFGIDWFDYRAVEGAAR